MFKKIFATACITCLALSVVGCSSKTANSVSNNLVTPTETVSENSTTVTVLDKYEAGDIASIANTGVDVGEVKNFTEDPNNEILTQVCYGTRPSGNNTYDSSGLTFYIFNTNEEADAALQYVKDNVVQTSSHTSNSYIFGLDKNAINIRVYHLYYKDLNMIVYKTIYMGDPDDTEMNDSFTIAKNNATSLYLEWKSIWNAGTIE